MQIIKNLIRSFTVMGLITSSYAAPPFQILQTCINDKPYNDKVTIAKLPNAGAADKSLDLCQDQYEFTFNGHTYGTVICNDKFFFNYS